MLALIRTTIVPFYAFLLTACGSNAVRSTAAEIVLGPVDTLITAESARLGKPTEIAIDRHGRLYITDLASSVILVVDSLGRALRAIGRAGAGPGEFAQPRSVTPIGDSLWVADPGNGRIQVLAADGAYGRTFSGPAAAASGAVAFRDDGTSLVSLNGFGGALVQHVSATGALGSTFGHPPVAGPTFWDFGALKTEIAEGRVPALFRNIAHPVPAPDGGTWLLLDGEAGIRRYDAQDSLRWEAVLAEPELGAIREEFFLRNRADSNPSSLYTLSYLVNGINVGSALWVLIRQPEDQPSLILILDDFGQVRARVRIPGALGTRAFAIDRVRRFLYLVDYQAAAVLRVRLPANLAPDTA